MSRRSFYASRSESDDSPAGGNEGGTSIGERHPAQLLEIDDREGRLRDQKPTLPPEPEGEPPIIYVEFTRVFPTQFLTFDLGSSNESNEETNPDDDRLRAFLREQKLDSAEQSFPPEVVPDRQRFLTLYFESNAGINQVCEELNQFPQVVHAVVAPRLKPPSGDPLNEPFIGFPLCDQVVTTLGFDNQWYIARCRIHHAWRQGLSGEGVVIADIDWGFLTTHEDLKDRITRQCNTRHNDDNVSRGNCYHHGTAVLGLAGAESNGKGMAGIAFGASLWAIQVGEISGMVDAPFWWAAIDRVSSMDSRGHRKIIILEVETLDSENIEKIPQIRTVIESAIARGDVVCVTAGNGHRDAGVDKNNIPFPPTGSILVGATHYDCRENPLAHFSNYGPRVTVYAPGDLRHDLTCSSGADNGYRNEFGGTSGAAAKVAGTIALMLEANPQLTHCEIKYILRETGSPIKTDIPNIVGVFLNAERAVCEAIKRAAR